MFNALFSQILGGLGGALSGGGAGAGAATGGMANPFSGALGSLTNLIGGPGSGSGSGTLFSLPNETLTNIADLGTSKNIIGDTLGLTKPALNLGDKALGGLGLGGLGGLNPFGSDSGLGSMSEVIRILGPLSLIAGASHLASEHRRSMYGDEEEY